MNIQALLEYLNLNSEAIYNGVFRKSNKPVIVKCVKCKRIYKTPYSVKKYEWLMGQPHICRRCYSEFTDALIERIGKVVFRKDRRNDKDIS